MTMGMSQMPGQVTQGPCEAVMKGLPTGSVDFILTYPPSLVPYKDRSGRTVPNDDNGSCLEPAFHEMQRVAKPGKFHSPARRTDAPSALGEMHAQHAPKRAVARPLGYAPGM